MWYAFACVASAAHRPEDAVQNLREAINRGYKDGDGLMGDDDLKNVRSDAKFLQLAASLKRPPARVQTP